MRQALDLRSLSVGQVLDVFKRKPTAGSSGREIAISETPPESKLTHS
jgi:hypothetical protein